MFALGNDIVNRVMEAGISNNDGDDDKMKMQKPEPSESMKVKETYIRAKYIDRKFVMGPAELIDSDEATTMTAFDIYTYSW